MSKLNIKAFRRVLQDSIRLEDEAWSYHVPDLPHPSILNPQQLLKSITLISNNAKQEIVLGLQVASPNRAISSQSIDHLISISFAGFRLQVPLSADQGVLTQPATAKESSDYIVRLLRSGVTLNNLHYNFYGHSNSQLKSRTCFLLADSKSNISHLIESFGDFNKIKSVPKKAKRIGLVFSAGRTVMTLTPDRYLDIPDIVRKDYIFTDGCGLIAPRFAQELSRKIKITFRNLRYTPSVFQIRYRGYKGVLMLDPAMTGNVVAKFRKSMKKFNGGSDYSFSVIEYSKPYGFGYLNDEVILLLHALGISETILLRKQLEHFEFLANASRSPLAAFRFLTYLDKPELAEKVLMDSLHTVRPAINKLVNSEYDRMLNKRDEQRCRILIPKSRLLFGICDAWDVLKEGECAIKVTLDGDGQARAIKGMDILVTRNPCLHPGDLQKFHVVERPELAHLVDCIVFPTQGKRPSADLMSGGDLDGDTFFVCWDSDLVPGKISEPAQYPGHKESVIFSSITDDDRLLYFAKYTNASLGKVKNLFIDWARLKGPMCAECQELNRLFSTCVDGNKIRVPERLESPPQPHADTPTYILDTLHAGAKTLIHTQQLKYANYDGYSFGAMELLLSRDDVAMSEFELLKLTHRWCLKNSSSLVEFLHLFDVNLLTSEEKAWTVDQLPVTIESGYIFNTLCQSNIVEISELKPFKLEYPGLKWKCVYDSSQDRLATFLDTAARILELFHRKLIVIRVDERLSLAIYVPQKIEGRQECQVDDRVRLFAFPHSQGDQSSRHRLSLPTKKNYRLYCDSNIFQLFESQRRNSWIYIKKAQSDDSTYRIKESTRERRRGRQATIESGRNFDCVTSVALDKFSKGLQQHIGRVNRNGLLGAEIYVISNKDITSMKNLDLWLEFVDTKEIIPLFERNAREYSIPKLSKVTWSDMPDYITRVAKERDFSVLNFLEKDEQYGQVFSWLLEKGETGLLLRSFQYLFGQFTARKLDSARTTEILEVMLAFLKDAPSLAIAFAHTQSWAALPQATYELLMMSTIRILKAFILSANDAQEFVVQPFKRVLSQTQTVRVSEFADLVELISLTVHSPDIALDLVFECIEPESSRILKGDNMALSHFVRNLFGIAIDHIDEAQQAQRPRRDLLNLNPAGSSNGYPLVKTNLRIDAMMGSLASSDHVRLTVASLPTNNPAGKICSVDALVEPSQPGSAIMRCFQPLPRFFEECSWELRNCGSFVTSQTMFDAVRRLAIEPENCCHISDQILGTGAQIQKSPTGPSQYIAKGTLNASQNEAVHASLSHTLTCLWGPPGTGKTHTIVEIIKQLQMHPSVTRILVSAPTHNAVDNVMRMYLTGVMREHPEMASPRVVRVSTDIHKVSEDLRRFTCDALAGKEIYTSHVALKKAREHIKRSKLVFTTCIGAGLGLLRSELFDTVIIDEASQLTEPASLVPLVKGSERAILVGDHVQLGATVQQHAVLQQFDVSLFERLYKQQTQNKVNTTNSSLIATVMLDTQYRMHESICKFSSNEFYEGKLQTGVAMSPKVLPSSKFPWPTTSTAAKEKRMVFVACSTPEDFGQRSKSNEGQVTLCHNICTMLCTQSAVLGTQDSASAADLLKDQLVAVLTPYSRQAELLKARLSQFSNVEVSSIDGFQGREADIVVFVTVRCNAHYEIGFLKDLRRMNVALTRARAGVIIIGDRPTLTMGAVDPTSTAVWKRLLAELIEIDIARTMI